MFLTLIKSVATISEVAVSVQPFVWHLYYTGRRRCVKSASFDLCCTFSTGDQISNDADVVTRFYVAERFGSHFRTVVDHLCSRQHLAVFVYPSAAVFFVLLISVALVGYSFARLEVELGIGFSHRSPILFVCRIIRF